MPFKYEKIQRFAGLANRRDFRDIGNGLSKAQNISLDVGGKIRTIGGLADFTKVDGATALTQTAKIAPGAGLFTYGSDHWRGADTIVDLGPGSNSASDEQGEVSATTGWSASGTGSISSDVGVKQVGSASIKITAGSGSATKAVLSSAVTTVIGQTYLAHAYIRKDSTNVTYPSIKIGSSSGDNDIAQSRAVYTDDTFEERTVTFIAIGTSTHVTIANAFNTAFIHFDDFYISAIPQIDLDTNWLALADVATAQVDLYSVNDDSFTAGLLDFGTVSSYVATIDTINFPTTKTITDSTGQFLNRGIQAGDIRIISGSALNNIMFVVEHVTTGTITARGNPFVVDADDDGTITLTKYNPVAFHYVNEALRASPANGGNLLRPKHYSFADRTHFEGADSSERKWSGWYANDVGPVAPTDIAFDSAVDSGLSGNLTAGAGWEVGMTVTADGGEWAEGTYIIACSFIYDDGQESALYVPSTDVAMTAITEGASLTLCAKADTATDYDERISGGRVYCRLDETDDPWTLLMDISMAKGARATLSGTYNAWAEGATADDVYTASFISKRQNIDSYESLAGIDPTTPVEVFTGDNAFWNTSVIARNRCFIGAPRYTAEGGALSHFRDRILYSTAGAYDTFPITNYIDVVQGDAEDYVKLGAYGNTLLAFKESTLYLIDISDPDDAGWQMKQDANEGKYPFRGIAHPGAYFETPVGPAWCNKFGVFLYNGSEIVPLLGDKIELSEHPLAYRRYMEFATNDYVIKADDANLDMGTADFSLELLIKTSHDYSTTYGYIINKGTGAGSYYIYIYTDNKLYWATRDSAEDIVNSDSVINDGEWHHIVCVADRDGTNKMYIDGVLQADTVSSSTGTVSNAEDFYIGRSNGGANFYFGDIALVHIWNRALTSAEVLALYNGQPVLAADQWGSQTALNVSNLANSAGQPYDVFQRIGGGGAPNTPFAFNAQKTTAGDIDKGGTTDEIAYVSGKKYVAEFDLTIDGGDIGILDMRAEDATSGGATVMDADSYAVAAGLNRIEMDCITTTTGVITWRSSAGLIDFDVENFKITQIGCVAQYEPKGIGDATWEDQSGNSLDGTVVGATAIFPDDWHSFYTDYSILGYHGRTNQLIIMRDCTGKWSSGRDYGDAFLIDLDTGAITTGRRVFTKGIAYSNWATDWNQELIIAEQTSSTLVTIKKITDEPQSQAVGLIDIRTADIEFGNPAFRKDIDAIIVTYKSSAAQTNPVSYALEDNDAQTAWTRLTGNFDPETNWEKLVIEPTPIECDSIRLKFDNPSSAGTIEINDATIRYTEIPEALS